MDCTFSTLAPSRVGFMRHDTLRAICEKHPRIAPSRTFNCLECSGPGSESQPNAGGPNEPRGVLPRNKSSTILLGGGCHHTHSKCRGVTATAFWRSTLIDAAIYREWVINVGRREALSRMAHMLCELIYRLRSVGRIKDHVAEIPITQAALGDALGLSTVHVNRMLQELRRKGLIATSGARMHVLNWPDLVHAGDFDTIYLHQRNPEAGQ